MNCSGIIITRSIRSFSRQDINCDITTSTGSDIKLVSFRINCDKIADNSIGYGDISIIKPNDIFTKGSGDAK